jgi:hypothetical protein
MGRSAYLDDVVLDDLIPRLKRLALFHNHDNQYRRGYLMNHGLTALEVVERTGGTDQYFDLLFPELINVRVQNGRNDSRPALIVLLEAVIKAGEADAEDQERYDDVVQSYRRWVVHRPATSKTPGPGPLDSSRTREAAAELQAARRRAGAAPPRRKKHYKIDADEVLIGFDLRRQIAFLTENLPDEGLFVISVAGEVGVLGDYVRARILKFLERERSGKVEPRDVYLRHSDFAGVGLAEVVPRLIAASFKSARLTDLLGQEPVDVFLTIWNQDVPLPQLEQLALAFVDRARQELEGAIARTSRIFIILWANSAGPPVRAGTVQALPEYDPVTTEGVIVWFRRCLNSAEVEPKDIERVLPKLRETLDRIHGAPPHIYRAMRSIIDELREGRL